MTDIPTLVGELVYLTGMTEAARHYVKEGQMLDLSSLNGRCAMLCIKLESVIGPESEMLHAAFRVLASELNLLEAELKASRDTTMIEISAAA
jgi:hypothetical protein